jgi:hypothetical protein
MPSQRLLKMMDPHGHLGAHRTLASTGPKAIVWAPKPELATWIASELRAANVEPLRAISFRHVETGLRAGLAPRCHLAVIDVRDLSDDQLNALLSARWAGFKGPIIAIGELAARWITLAHLTVVENGGGLREQVSRFVTRQFRDE